MTNVLIRDEAPADGMGLFEAARLVGYPMSLPNLHSQRIDLPGPVPVDSAIVDLPVGPTVDTRHTVLASP